MELEGKMPCSGLVIHDFSFLVSAIDSLEKTLFGIVMETQLLLSLGSIYLE